MRRCELHLLVLKLTSEVGANSFSDVNPPVHAWATFRVFKIERKMHGREDLAFLERVFQKLLLNFTWCVSVLAYGLRRVVAEADQPSAAGGSTEKTLAVRTFSKEDSLVSTTSVPSTDPSLSPPAVFCVRPTVPPGWLSSP